MASFGFEIAPRLYERFWGNAKLLGNGDQIRFMRFEEAEDSGQEPGLTRPATKLVCPDSGQVDEPLGASCVTKCCRKRA